MRLEMLICTKMFHDSCLNSLIIKMKLYFCVSKTNIKSYMDTDPYPANNLKTYMDGV